MIGCVEVKCVAAKPNFPLVPLFAFKGSPSSIRILDVPKSIGTWEITSVRVLMKYPDNSTIEKVATRTGSVWVATVEGCDTTGKVGKGYEILADGIDENGDDVVGYVLGAGDIYILDRDSDVDPDDQKVYVKYCQDIPDSPAKGDLILVDVNANGVTQIKIWNGEEWKAQTLYTKTSELINDAGFITASAIPSQISAFENDVGYITASAIPSTISSFENDVGYITDEAIPSNVTAFNNDAGYITAEAIPSDISSFNNDVGYITASALPTKVSELENDSGYITESAIPSNVGAFQNDVGYLTSVSWGEVQDKPDVALMSDLPSKVSELDNDEGFITANAIPSNVGAFENDVGYLTASAQTITNLNTRVSAIGESVSALAAPITGKRDYLDLSYPAINNNINDGFGVSAFTLKFDDPLIQPTDTLNLDNFTVSGGYAYWSNSNETARGTWQVRTSDGLTFEHTKVDNPFQSGAGFTMQEMLAGSVAQREWPQVEGGGRKACVYNGTLKRQNTKIALEDYVNAQISSAIPSNVSEFNNDVGYLTASSSAFTAKRDKTDMSAVVGTIYASWNLSELHTNTYSPALELKWGTYNVFGQEQGCWLVDDEYRQLCFFLMPELNMLYWGVRNQDGSYIAGYGETITLSSDELSIATINGVAEITCTRTSKDGTPEVSTIATLKDLQGFQNINEKRDWWDNTTPASVDDSGKYTINNFSVMVGSSSYVLDQFSKSGSTSTWKTTGGDYPSITTTDGLNFTLNSDSSTSTNFSIDELKPGPATGTIGGNNYSALANFMLTTFALKDYVDSQIGSINTILDNINGEVI